MGKMKIDKLIKSRRKTIGLYVGSDASLIVRAPAWAKIADIEKVVAGHQDWIQKRKEEAILRLKSLPPRRYLDGEEFPYLGQNYRLRLTDDPKIALSFGDSFYLSKIYHAKARQAFTIWYKYRARIIIPERVKLCAMNENLKYGRVGITNAGRRWGSCSGKGNLNFAWRLVMAPKEVIDYVVAHELAHLKVKNHSRRFWDRVKEIDPDFLKHRLWLRENGWKLTL